MNNSRQKMQFSPFKARLQDRRVFNAPERRTSRRSRIYTGQVAEVLARLG
jgi:hypothetical protein